MLGKIIKRLREERHWSQKKLASLLGVTEITIRRWESSDSEPYQYHRIQLYRFLGIPLSPYLRVQGMSAMQEEATYFVQGQHVDQEYLRLHAQAQMVSSTLGGVLPDQPDPGRFKRVLDIGCGTGDWLIALAQINPQATELVGIDVNAKTLQFAESQAEQASVETRVTFHEMDALQPLAFSDASFDMVNLRFGISFVRAESWPNLLKEMKRLLAPNGVVRLVELQYLQSNSEALNLFWEIGAQAADMAGYLVVSEVAAAFPRFLVETGLRDIQSRIVSPTYRPGSLEFALFAEDMRRLLTHSAPFLQAKLTLGGYQRLSARINADLIKSDFEATWPIFTAWGTK